MFLGYLTLGRLEVGNAMRTAAYAQKAGLNWFKNCSSCDVLANALPMGLGTPTRSGSYDTPVNDPAPWAEPDELAENPDLAEFYGMVPLEITGTDDSTRVVNTTASVTGGSSSGRTYFRERTMVLRALLVAQDDCGLQAGLGWLRSLPQAETTATCSGAEMTFFECCPCSCTDLEGEVPDRPGEPEQGRWPWDFQEGSWDQQGTETWNGTSPGIDQMLGTIDQHPLETIDTSFVTGSECIAECVLPYRVRLKEVRPTSGPTVLERHNISCGAAMTVEITFVAGDPKRYSDTVPAAVIPVVGGVAVRDSGQREVTVRDPFRPDLEIVARPTRRETLPQEWLRTETPVSWDGLDDLPGSLAPTIRVSTAGTAASGVRVSLRDGLGEDGEIASYFMRWIPAWSSVEIDVVSRRVTVTHDGVTQRRSDVVIGGDGGPVRWPISIGYRPSLRMLVDRAVDVPVEVSVMAARVREN